MECHRLHLNNFNTKCKKCILHNCFYTIQEFLDTPTSCMLQNNTHFYTLTDIIWLDCTMCRCTFISVLLYISIYYSNLICDSCVAYYFINTIEVFYFSCEVHQHVLLYFQGVK